MALTKIDDRGLKTPIDLIDNEKIRFGTGNDLEVFHDGSNSYIKDVGTGNLLIDQSTANVLYIRSDDLRLSTWTGTETYIDCNVNGSVELYYDGVKTFETHGKGITVQGPEGDDADILLNADEGDDNADKWRVRADSVASGFYIQNYESGSWEESIKAHGGGNVALYYDNSLSLETWADGVKIHDLENNTCELQLTTAQGDGGSLYADTAASPSGAFGLLTTAAEWAVKSHNNGNVELYWNNERKFYTQSWGATVEDTTATSAWLQLTTSDGICGYLVGISNGTDRDIALYDASGGELHLKASQNGAVELYHDNAKHSYTTTYGFAVKRPSGGQTEFDVLGCEGNDAVIRLLPDDGDDNADYWKLNAAAAGGFFLENLESGAWETNIKAVGGGSVSLYYNNVEKLRTDSSGVGCHGDCYPINDNSYDVGNSSSKWDDVYATNGTIQTSDRNAKKDIVKSDLGLTFINAIEPVSYKFKTGTRTHYGVIAQDLETVLDGKDFAGLTKDTETGNYGLRYTEFISPLIKAVQELSAEVETLKTKVAALEAA